VKLIKIEVWDFDSRIIKVREDKDPTDATDSTQIAAWYKNQAAVKNDDY